MSQKKDTGLNTNPWPKLVDHYSIYSSITWRDVDFYSETEKALLAWTESVTILNDESNKYRQQAFENLSQHFSQDEIANLTLAIMQINSWIRLAKSFGFEAGTYQIGQY